MVRRSKSLLISVIGGSNANGEYLDLAYQVGQELARRGAIVVCGGLAGIMKSVCKGAKEAGGTTIGILPGNDPGEANPYVDLPICTGIGYARNVIVVKSGRAVIAIDGAFGTLSEIGHALGDAIPVIGLRTWNISQDNKVARYIIPANDPVDAVEKAIAAARQRSSRKKRAK
ncbi:MAG: TIGR00725 family protein [Chloroflexi bacterium]|nr:TIGR00725 family protein [Chloroflexota bacterium]